MRTSHWSFRWLNVFTLVFLLLNLAPVQTQAAPAQETHNISPDTIEPPSASPLPAIPDGWAAVHPSPGEAPATDSPPALDVLPPWWTIASHFQSNDSTTNSSPLSSSEDVPDGYTAHLWAGTSNAGVWYHDEIT